MGLSKQIRELRLQRDWTQQELANRSGLGRRTISYLEQEDRERTPADILVKLAKAFNIKTEDLYKETDQPHPETPEELLNKLRLATPQSIPVYPWEAFPFHAGTGIEPTEYIYRARPKMASKNIEAYIVHGKCLEPKITDGDIIIVDRQGSIDNGDVVACLLDGQLHVLLVRKVADEIWLENNCGKFKFEECRDAAPVIEVIKRLK